MSKKTYTALVIIILSFILFIENINAEETIDITNNSQIKYKWYKNEKIDGRYYIKGEKLDGYLEDLHNIKYGKFTDWDYKYCGYSTDKYIKEYHTDRAYKKVIGTSYIKLNNFNKNNFKIHIYNNRKEVEYKTIKSDDSEIIIALDKSYDTENLFFYIKTDQSYDIHLSYIFSFTMNALYKHIENTENTEILIPDKTWIYDKTIYVNELTEQNIPNNDFRKLERIRQTCRVKEIQTYRYKINKKYYDDKYHSYIMDYQPDLKDYVIEYNGKLPVKIETITNTVKEEKIKPIKEFIYMEKNNSANQDNNIKKNEPLKPKIKYIENDIIKEVKSTSKTIYLIILILLLIIIVEFILLFKKNVDENN